MKILAIGDPHFRIDNIPEVEMFIDRIEELAKARKPDLIVCLGDLLHTHERIHTIPLNKAYDFIRRMSEIAFTYVLVGNHDYIQNQQFLTENHWMNAMKSWKNVCVVDKVVEHKFILLCPYVPNGRFVEALTTFTDDYKSYKFIFAHQEFYGCKMGAIVSVDGDKWSEDDPMIISGHIHSKQQPQPNIYYTGSALQHAFGESEKNTIAFITISEDDFEFSIDEVDLKLPRKKIVYLNMEQAETYELPKDSEDDVKLTISGSYDDFKAFKKSDTFKTLCKEGAKVVFKADKDVKPVVQQQRNVCDFKSILRDIVVATKDSMLLQQYELVVNNKKPEEDRMTLLL